MAEHSSQDQQQNQQQPDSATIIGEPEPQQQQQQSHSQLGIATAIKLCWATTGVTILTLVGRAIYERFFGDEDKLRQWQQRKEAIQKYWKLWEKGQLMFVPVWVSGWVSGWRWTSWNQVQVQASPNSINGKPLKQKKKNKKEKEKKLKNLVVEQNAKLKKHQQLQLPSNNRSNKEDTNQNTNKNINTAQKTQTQKSLATQQTTQEHKNIAQQRIKQIQSSVTNSNWNGTGTGRGLAKQRSKSQSLSSDTDDSHSVVSQQSITESLQSLLDRSTGIFNGALLPNQESGEIDVGVGLGLGVDLNIWNEQQQFNDEDVDNQNNQNENNQKNHNSNIGKPKHDQDIHIDMSMNVDLQLEWNWKKWKWLQMQLQWNKKKRELESFIGQVRSSWEGHWVDNGNISKCNGTDDKQTKSGQWQWHSQCSKGDPTQQNQNQQIHDNIDKQQHQQHIDPDSSLLSFNNDTSSGYERQRSSECEIEKNTNAASNTNKPNLTGEWICIAGTDMQGFLEAYGLKWFAAAISKEVSKFPGAPLSLQHVHWNWNKEYQKNQGSQGQQINDTFQMTMKAGLISFGFKAEIWADFLGWSEQKIHAISGWMKSMWSWTDKHEICCTFYDWDRESQQQYSSSKQQKQHQNLSKKGKKLKNRQGLMILSMGKTKIQKGQAQGSVWGLNSTSMSIGLASSSSRSSRSSQQGHGGSGDTDTQDIDQHAEQEKEQDLKEVDIMCMALMIVEKSSNQIVGGKKGVCYRYYIRTDTDENDQDYVDEHESVVEKENKLGNQQLYVEVDPDYDSISSDTAIKNKNKINSNYNSKDKYQQWQTGEPSRNSESDHSEQMEKKKNIMHSSKNQKNKHYNNHSEQDQNIKLNKNSNSNLKVNDNDKDNANKNLENNKDILETSNDCDFSKDVEQQQQKQLQQKKQQKQQQKQNFQKQKPSSSHDVGIFTIDEEGKSDFSNSMQSGLLTGESQPASASDQSLAINCKNTIIDID